MRGFTVHPHHAPNEMGQRGGGVTAGQEALQQRLAVVFTDFDQRLLKALQVGLRERLVNPKTMDHDVVEAFVHRKTLDAVTYDERVSRENEGLALARLELVQAQTDELDLEVLLDFGENLMMNTAQMWLDLGFEQKLRFQRVLFPDGLTFDGESFGTVVTSPVINYLRDISTGKVSMASHTVPSWNQIMPWLREMAELRESGVVAA